MTVGELRAKMRGLPDSMMVELEVTLGNGTSLGEDEIAGGDLLAASVEERCDEVPRFYLFGEHGRVQAPPAEPIELLLVP